MHMDTWLTDELPISQFNLGPDGGMVTFIHFREGTHHCFGYSPQHAKNLILQGQLCLYFEGSRQFLGVGDWFEVPQGSEHKIDYLTDCSLLEIRYS